MGEPAFKIKYTFSNFLTDSAVQEPSHFVNEYKIKIWLLDSSDQKVELVGKGRFSVLLFSLAEENGCPLFDIMDVNDHVLEMSAYLFSHEEESDYWEKIDNYYSEEPLIENLNIGFLERLELLPEYRGLGVGERVIQDIASRFYNSCGLIVAKAVPLQQSEYLLQTKWGKKLRLNNLSNDEETASYKLYNFFQKLGFDNPFHEKYFIAKPEHIVRKLVEKQGNNNSNYDSLEDDDSELPF
ncbi:hypothetical protein RCC89_12560 [Cytophagaceae bacterium ABcell3]|nr:hypothetical protein RCC89_12560 [Cytophagaceae bacterium ABcell3]